MDKIIKVNEREYFFRTYKTQSHNKQKFGFTSENYVFLDTETAKTDIDKEYSQAVAFSLCDFKNNFAICSKTVTRQEELYIDLFDILFKYSIGKTDTIRCYYHNSTFDCMFLLTELRAKNYEQIDRFDKAIKKELTEEDKFFSMIVSNNKIIEVCFSYKKKIFKIWDTYNIWATSLDSISTELIKINEIDRQNNRTVSFPNILSKSNDTVFDYDKIRHIGDTFTQTDIDYMLNDVLVSSAIVKVFGFLDLKMTISATAYNLCIKSLVDGIYTSSVNKYLLQEMILKDDINKVNISSLVKSVRNEYGYELHIKNYYDDIDNTTYLCSLNFSELINQEKTTIKTFFKDNFDVIIYKLSTIEYVELSVIQKEINIYPFYVFHKSNFKTTYHFLKFFYTFLNVDNGSYKHNKRVIELVSQFNSYFFPKIPYELDKILRRSYKGGICQVNPLFQYTEVSNIFHIDIRSSYPHKMGWGILPYGLPNIHEQEVERKKDCVYMYEFICDYQIKDGYLPNIFSKAIYGNAKMSTSGDFQTMLIGEDGKNHIYMWDIEIEVFKRIYNVENFHVLRVFEFKAQEKLFHRFNDKFYKFKQSKKGTVLYNPAKILINSTTGKFGQNKYRMEKEKVILNQSKSVISFQRIENRDYNADNVNTYYLPVVSYCLAQARTQLMNGCNDIIEKNGTVFYMDTDSLFFTADSVKTVDGILYINDEPTSIVLHKNDIGTWDMEHGEIYKTENNTNYYKGIQEVALFLNPKRYFIDGDQKNKITKCAGIDRKTANAIKRNEFKFGQIFSSLQKSKNKYGVELTKKAKQLKYSENLYKTTCGVVSTKVDMEVGSLIKNVYGKIGKVTEILYKI